MALILNFSVISEAGTKNSIMFQTKKEHQVETTPLSHAFVDVYNLHECKNVYSR